VAAAEAVSGLLVRPGKQVRWSVARSVAGLEAAQRSACRGRRLAPSERRRRRPVRRMRPEAARRCGPQAAMLSARPLPAAWWAWRRGAAARRCFRRAEAWSLELSSAPVQSAWRVWRRGAVAPSCFRRAEERRPAAQSEPAWWQAPAAVWCQTAVAAEAR
jgi:hypothetical protein